MQKRPTKQQGLCHRVRGSSVCLTALVFVPAEKKKCLKELWKIGVAFRNAKTSSSCKLPFQRPWKKKNHAQENSTLKSNCVPLCYNNSKALSLSTWKSFRAVGTERKQKWLTFGPGKKEKLIQNCNLTICASLKWNFKITDAVTLVKVCFFYLPWCLFSLVWHHPNKWLNMSLF